MNKDINKIIEQLETLLAKAHPLPWLWHANVPFYVEVRKPRESLSKHNDGHPTYWHYDDGAYAAAAIHAAPKLIAEIKRLRDEKA